MLLKCILLYRNRDVTASRCHTEVKFILTWNTVMLHWLAAESNWYSGTATQSRCSMNRLSVWQESWNLAWFSELILDQTLYKCDMHCKQKTVIFFFCCGLLSLNISPFEGNKHNWLEHFFFLYWCYPLQP